MKRSLLILAGCGALGISVPLIAFAQFAGPTQAPPYGNVNGVIWNNPAVPQSATINITGPATVQQVQTSPNIRNNVYGDNYLQDGKAFRVDGSPSTTYWMGNWFSGNLPMTFNVQGGLNVTDLGTGGSTLGSDGRVQAVKLCFYNFGMPDCRTSWSSVGAGNYVLKTGDSMTGPLQIVSASAPLYVQSSSNAYPITAYGGTTAVFASGTNYGVEGIGNQYGVYGSGATAGIYGTSNYIGGSFTSGNIAVDATGMGSGWAFHGYNAVKGGDFTGSSVGVDVHTQNAGSGIAVQGQNGNIGGNFVGLTTGVQAAGQSNANSYGVDAQGLIGVRAQSSNPASGLSRGILAANAQIAGDFTGTLRGITSSGGTYGVYGISTSTSAGAGIYGQGYNGAMFSGTNEGGIFTGNNFGVDATTAVAGSGTAVRGLNGSTGGDFTGVSYGVKGAGTGAGPGYGGYFTSPSAIAVYGSGYTGGLFQDNSGDTTYLAYPGYAIYSIGQMYASQNITTGGLLSSFSGLNVSGAGGVVLNQSNSPMITRSWDAFTSDATNEGKTGLGRWGMFMEPGVLTMGIPNISGRAWRVADYNPDGTTAANLLYVNQNGNVYIDAGGLTLGNTGVANLVINNGNAWKPGGGSWNVTSDARLKDIHGDFSRGLRDLMGIQPVSYNYKSGNAMNLPSDQTYIGVVAQNVKQSIPEAVSTNDKGYLQVNNDPIIWTMLNSIKELKAENDQLKARLDKLEQK